MALQSHSSFRLSAATFAVVLGLLAAWLIAAELTRPRLSFFPIENADVEAAISRNSVMATAASIGWPRGDLWVDAAITANAIQLGNIESGGTTTQVPASDQALAIAETAVTLAPSDARAWLILAMGNEQSPSSQTKTLAQLKMSYYTSPYNNDLFPLRIQLIARLPAINDEEIRSFVEYEIGTILREKPDLKPLIVSAFRNGSPAGRQLLEAAVGTKDAQLVGELRAISP